MSEARSHRLTPLSLALSAPGLVDQGRGEADVAAPDGELLAGVVLAEHRGNQSRQRRSA